MLGQVGSMTVQITQHLSAMPEVSLSCAWKAEYRPVVKEHQEDGRHISDGKWRRWLLHWNSMAKAAEPLIILKA